MRAVGNQQRRRAQPAFCKVGEEFFPSRFALAHGLTNRQQMLFAEAISAENHQKNAALVIGTGSQVNAIGPGEDQSHVI